MNTMTNIEKSQMDSTEKAIQMLSRGILDLYAPEFIQVKQSLSELIEKQTKVENDLTNEIGTISERNLCETQIMINNFQLYKDKLQAIKKQMLQIHQKANNLKKRALFLEEFKKKELIQKIAKRQHEEGLIGKSPIITKPETVAETVAAATIATTMVTPSTSPSSSLSPQSAE